MTAAVSLEEEMEWEWIFHPKEIPTLFSTAMRKLVQFLWRNEIIEKRLQGELKSLFNDNQPSIIDLRYRTIEISWNEREKNSHKDVLSFSKSLSDIHSKMQNYAYDLKNDCENWVANRTGILNRFDDFAYDIKGRIDDTLTVRNMLSFGKFSVIEKYVLACTYCFEDEVRRIWPSVLSQEINVADISYSDHCLVRYWTNRMMNRSSQPLSCSQIFLSEALKPSSRQYFLDNIPDFYRKYNVIGFAFRIGLENVTTCCARDLFPKFDCKFLKAVVLNYGSQILADMVLCSDNRCFVLPFWLRTKDWFNGDMFVEVFESIMQNSHVDVFDLDDSDDEDNIQLPRQKLAKVIWDNASTPLKDFALNYFQVHSPDDWDEFELLIT